MLKLIRPFLSLIFCCYPLAASPQDFIASLGAGLSGAQTSSTKSISLMSGVLFPVLCEGKVRVGGGIRYSHWQRNGRLDLGESRAIEVSGLDVGALNAVLLAEVAVFDRFAFGMNLDLLGFSHGGETDLIGVNGRAKPESRNLFLGGRNDRGTLNSEFFIGYHLERFRIAAGWAHQVTEYLARDLATEKLQRFFDTAIVRLDYFF